MKKVTIATAALIIDKCYLSSDSKYRIAVCRARTFDKICVPKLDKINHYSLSSTHLMQITFLSHHIKWTDPKSSFPSCSPYTLSSNRAKQ